MILRGLDADCCACLATVDWNPLDSRGELQALLQRRVTYQLRREGQHLVLVRRNPRLILARPPGGRDGYGAYDILADHHCWSAPLPGVATRLINPPSIEEDECPF